MKLNYCKAILLFIVFAAFATTGYSQKLLYATLGSDSSTVGEKFDSTMLGPKMKIKLDPNTLSAPANQKLVISLPKAGFPNGVPVVIQKKKQEAKPGQFAWYGEIEGQPGSFVLLTQVENVLAGHIRTNENKLYRIFFIGNNLHRIAEIDQNLFKPDRVDPPGSILNNLSGNERTRADASTCCDTTGTIDILVVYTPEAMRRAGGARAIEAEIYESINITNESFLNSNIRAKIELVHSEKINYRETGNILEARDALQNPADRIMDNIHTLRDSYAADIVFLFIENSDLYSGLSYIMESVSTSFDSLAFAIVKRDAATSNLSLAHELGHIMGARHECSIDTSLKPYAFCHGYSFGSYRTIMSINRGALRVEYWSNPDVYFPNTRDPSGVISGDCSSNDAECLRNTVPVVSIFRCKQQCPASNMLIYSLHTEPPPPPPPPPPSNWWLWLIVGIIVIVVLIIVLTRKRRNQGDTG